ncbi:WD40/YVTN/BNR-like repeat-containing protein [Nitrospira sp. Kam-Ns4a]
MRLTTGQIPTAIHAAWLLLTLWLPGCGNQSETIAAIALHPTNPNIWYVATNDSVYKTRDGGATWEQFPNFSARRVTTLALDPEFPANVFAGTMGDAVYKSPDGGQHWLPHNVGLKEHVSYVNQFVFHPTQHDTMYAATTVGIFRTTDGGRTWEEQMNGMKEVHIVVTLAINPHNPRILYAGTTGGAYRSLDAAASWHKINNGLIPAEVLEASLSLGINTLIIDPANPDTVYAGTTKGLFKTTNRGDLWVRIGQSLGDQFVSSLVLHPGNPNILYAGGRAGVFKSLDGGQTWQAINEGLATLNVRTIVMNPKNPETLFCGTNGSGLYVSRNGGKTWTRVPLTAGPGRALPQST